MKLLLLSDMVSEYTPAAVRKASRRPVLEARGQALSAPWWLL
ncbi:MAG: hypothetical protein RMK29_07700 [Myxococcales bacterium]|nr:hypothetical protein [Myxococcota bacterium]MDW8281579.1 hypothetical protein [Myxococcales bacterium]